MVSPLSVKTQVATWRKQLPDIIPHYAVKSNPDLEILKILHKEDVRFDCASVREINDIHAICGNSDSILYANPHKSEADCYHSSSLNIGRTVVDSPEEVEKIAHTNWRPEILIRLAVDDAASRSPFSINFGAEKSMWNRIIKKIYQYNLTFCGVSFHVGSASKDPTQYGKAIDTCRDFSSYTDEPLRIVDIGGGFTPQTFNESCTEIHRARERWQASPTTYPTQWIAEPGRFLSSKTHTLYAPIIARKAGVNGKGWRYLLDESIYGQFSCIPFDHAQPHWLHCNDLAVPANPANFQKDRGILFGRTCDSIDLLAYSEKMRVMKEGDWLCFPEMGAYTTSSSSEFNGFPKPPTYYQEAGWVKHAPVNKDIIFPVEARSSIQLAVHN